MFSKKVRDPATMTNAQIVKEHARHMERQSEVATRMIDDGFGSLRPSDMRKDPDCHPLARETLASFDRCRALGIEANMRYGPGLVGVRDLVVSQGKGYRRVRLPKPGEG